MSDTDNLNGNDLLESNISPEDIDIIAEALNDDSRQEQNGDPLERAVQSKAYQALSERFYNAAEQVENPFAKAFLNTVAGSLEYRSSPYTSDQLRAIDNMLSHSRAYSDLKEKIMEKIDPDKADAIGKVFDAIDKFDRLRLSDPKELFENIKAAFDKENTNDKEIDKSENDLEKEPESIENEKSDIESEQNNEDIEKPNEAAEAQQNDNIDKTDTLQNIEQQNTLTDVSETKEPIDVQQRGADAESDKTDNQPDTDIDENSDTDNEQNSDRNDIPDTAEDKQSENEDIENNDNHSSEDSMEAELPDSRDGVTTEDDDDGDEASADGDQGERDYTGVEYKSDIDIKRPADEGESDLDEDARRDNADITDEMDIPDMGDLDSVDDIEFADTDTDVDNVDEQSYPENEESYQDNNDTFELDSMGASDADDDGDIDNDAADKGIADNDIESAESNDITEKSSEIGEDTINNDTDFQEDNDLDLKTESGPDLEQEDNIDLNTDSELNTNTNTNDMDSSLSQADDISQPQQQDISTDSDIPDTEAEPLNENDISPQTVESSEDIPQGSDNTFDTADIDNDGFNNETESEEFDSGDNIADMINDAAMDNAESDTSDEFVENNNSGVDNETLGTDTLESSMPDENAADIINDMADTQSQMADDSINEANDIEADNSFADSGMDSYDSSSNFDSSNDNYNDLAFDNTPDVQPELDYAEVTPPSDNIGDIIENMSDSEIEAMAEDIGVDVDELEELLELLL